MASAEPFEPARSSRRFTIGTPDGIAAVVLPPLLAEIRHEAPAIDVRVRQLLPAAAPAALDTREVDIAIVPADDSLPARFVARALYGEDFVVAMRAGHPIGSAPSLGAYCAAQHLLVSPTGDARGFVDAVLETRGLSRRIALTVPSFMLGLAVIAETDLVAAMPRRQVAMYGPRFDVMSAELPAPLGRFRVSTVTPTAAMADAGLSWLLGLLDATSRHRVAGQSFG
jgi:DNA-binding transcriptional LysR family regulator